MIIKNLVYLVILSKKSLLLPTLILLLALVGCDGRGSGGGSSSTSTIPDSTDTDTGTDPNTAILTIDAPTTNADGTPLTDLAGYKVYYGTESGNYTEIIDISIPSCEDIGDKTECTYIVEDLDPGIYYFTVTAYDTSGNESDYSNEVSKTVT